MDEQTYINGIKNRSDSDYPAVVQVSDPLLVRVSKTSLLLNDTTFYAKIKKGLAFNGYVIYSSGIGTPIIEVDIGSTPETTSTGTVTNKTENDVDISEIEQAASEFLDKLEARIATSELQNPIKASIDRLCWQIHYDITKSKTNFVTAFEDQGFAKIVTSVDGWSSSSTTDGATFYDYFADLDTSIGTDNSGLIGATKQIATSLRADDGEYTISKALRDSDDDANVKCVSWSVKEQTDLERVQFLDISENRLGSFGTSMNEDPNTHQPLYTHRSLFDSMNGASTGYSITTDKRLDEVLGSDRSSSGAFDDSLIARVGKNGDTNNGTLFAWTKKTDDDVLGVSSKVGTKDDAAGVDTLFAMSKTMNNNIGDENSTETDTSTLFGLTKGIKKKANSLSYAVLGGTDYTSAPTDNIYTALLDSGRGALQKGYGYLYAADHFDPYYMQDSGGSPKAYTDHYYIATETSRYALMWNVGTTSPQLVNFNAIKSQEPTQTKPW